MRGLREKELNAEELALVNGATYEVLYGEDANMNGVLDPNEDDGEESAPTDNSDGKATGNPRSDE